jgi:hypothetical protein
MSVVVIRQQLAAAEGEHTRLVEDRARVQAALDELLARTAPAGPFGYDPVQARRYRADLAVYDARLADATDRITALAAQLPSATQIAEAQVACLALQSTVGEAELTFSRATTAFCAALEAAEDAARQLLAARTTCRSALASLTTTAAIVGRDGTVPLLPTIPPALGKYLYLQATFIRDATQGDADSLVVRDLNAARERLPTSETRRVAAPGKVPGS